MRAHIVVLIDCAWQEAQTRFCGFISDRLAHRLRTVERISLDWAAVESQGAASRRIWQISRQLNQMGYRLALLMDNFDAVFENQLLTPDAVDELRPLTLEIALVVATETPAARPGPRVGRIPAVQRDDPALRGPHRTEAGLAGSLLREAYPPSSPCAMTLEMTGFASVPLHVWVILAGTETC